MSIFEVRERLWSTFRLTSNGDRRTGRGFMKVEKKDLNISFICIIKLPHFSKKNFTMTCYLGVVMYL